MNKRQAKKRNKQIAQAAAILGALGGASRSPKKAAASRANGKKGGRPRKDAATAKAMTFEDVTDSTTVQGAQADARRNALADAVTRWRKGGA